MDVSIAVQALGLAAVVGGLVWDMRSQREPIPQGRAKAEAAGDEQRCPFCHEGYEGLAGTVRCKRCGTRHHNECWGSHGGCTVYGCESDLVRAPEVEVPADEEAPSETTDAQALTESTPCV